MNKKIICVLANGYAEEMMAAVLMDEMRKVLGARSEEFLFVGGSLVSSGRWYQEKRFPTFFSGGMSPSGGFPTRSLGGFFSDLFAGVFKGPFEMARFVKSWAGNGMEMVIVVGDFLLLATAMPALKKKNVPCIFIPTAKSDYIQSHYKIEKKYIQKYASLSFPRDEITAQDFRDFGIKAEYLGNLMQDLLNPRAEALEAEEPIVALLPGSREESYGNLGLILEIVEKIGRSVHWAFVQAAALDSQRVEDVFKKRGWNFKPAEAPLGLWTDGVHKVRVYPGSDFDSVALGCVVGISLAGTVGDQIAGLGKPILGFVGTGPQSSKMRMKEYEKLLGPAFIYEKKYPDGAVSALNALLADKNLRSELGLEGLRRMGAKGGAAKMAQRILGLYLKI